MYHHNAKLRRKIRYFRLGGLIALALVMGSALSPQLIGSNVLPLLKIVNQVNVPLDSLAGMTLYSDGGTKKISLIGENRPLNMSFAYSADLFNEGKAIGLPRQYDFEQTITEYYNICPAKIGKRCKEIRKILTSDFQALAIDGMARTFILQQGSATLFAFDAGFSHIEALIRLNFEPLIDAEAHDDENALGTGLLLMHAGHILVAKKRGPAALIEFGPAGDQPMGVSVANLLADGETFTLPSAVMGTVLQPLKVWRRSQSDRCDFSDLAKDSFGRIFILSSNCSTITMVNTLPVTADEFDSAAAWQLPKIIKKAEGLVVIDREKFVVGADLNKHKPNVFFLESTN